jgi:hypothetical protein
MPLHQDIEDRHGEGNILKDQAYYERLGASPLHPMACGSIQPSSVETGAERGLSRPGLLKPVQLSGAIEPVSARKGFQPNERS